MKIMTDVLKKVEPPRPKLISVADAASDLGVHAASVRRHLPLVRIGGRILVRVADVEAKIREGQSNAAG